MKYFRCSFILVYIGLLSLLQLDHTEAKKKRNRHRRHNNLEWTAWTEWSSCTAQCGTGAAFRERKCINRRMRAYSNKCHGKKHQFKICNTQECIHRQETLREQLCSKHNIDVIGGKRYRWLPYLLHSARCELTCKADGQGFYNSFPDPVLNGTTCSKDGLSVCVEGVCKKFGCDGIVGSKTKKDICGVCNGDNSKCKLIEDVYEEDGPDMNYGYNLITIIPSGATSINVTQLRHGRNYLALKYKDGKYIINGRRRLQSSGKYEAAGTTFNYKNRASKHCPGECLLADGPTTKDLEIMLLYFGKNTGVLYKFGYPTDRNGMLKYQDLNFDKKSRNSIRVDNENPGRKSTNDKTQRGGIDYRIQYNGNSKNDYHNEVSGRNRVRSRNRNRNRDRNINRDGTTNINSHRNYNAHNRRLPTERYDASVVIEESESTPNRNVPGIKKEKSYYITSLSGKSRLPGYTQSFTFMDKMKEKMHKNGILGNGQNDPMYPDSDRRRGQGSRNGRRPIIVSNPIDPGTIASVYNWKVTGYTKCNRTCGTGIQYPIVKCLSDEKEIPDMYCRKLSKPNDTPIECNTQACPASWEASAWTPCSVTCDEGIQIRNISCLKEVAESLYLEAPFEDCSSELAPNTSQSCKNKDCFTWVTNPWSECSANCGQGLKIRTVNCTSPDGYYVHDLYCNKTEMPAEEEGCYSSACENRYSAAWYHTHWQDECSAPCGKGKQRRRVVCVSENPYGPDCEEREKLADERTCQAPDSCNGYWFSGPWQKCNSTCGEGMQTRDVVCLRPNGNTAYEIIPDEYCNMADRPVDYEACMSSPCPPEWFMSEWNECSVTCDKGQRSREVICIDTDHNEVNSCDQTVKPRSSEECGGTPCNVYSPVTESCKDTYPSCNLVVQAGMCVHDGYRRVCCESCSAQG